MDTIAITGGGTGGHLIVAKTIAQTLKKNGFRLIFIGSNGGQDRKWFENSDIFDKKYFFDSAGVVNKRGFKKISSLANIFQLSLKCKQIFIDENISAVFSVGGYSAAPAAIAAVLYRKPLFIHEQNSVIGKLNEYLKPFARKFYSSYGKKKFSYPVDEKFFDMARDRIEKKCVIFLGGSQGASFINSLAKELAPMLISNHIEVIHQCGEQELEATQKFYQDAGLNVVVLGFCSDIEKYMTRADICIGRSGASTLWELCANRLPMIFIPFEFAANDHQYFNARFLFDNNLAALCRQEDASAEQIFSFIKNINVKKISSGLSNVFERGGAQKIVDDMIANLNKRNKKS